MRTTLMLLVIGLLLGRAPGAFAFSTGISGLTLDANGCNNCHTGGSTPTVQLVGPTTVSPGATTEYVLEISEIGTQTRGGLDAAASSGTVAVGGTYASGTKLLAGEITHTGPKMGDGDKIRFSFMWTAPLTGGPFTLRAWGNAVDASGFSFGDRAAFASLVVSTGATPTPTLVPTPTASPTPYSHDAVALPVVPVNLTIPVSQPVFVSKTVSLKVRNGNPRGGPAQTLDLSLTTTDCPPGVVFDVPDFVPAAPGSQNQVLLNPGQSKAAKVAVIAAHSAVTTFSPKVPLRCAATFHASSVVPGNVDPSPTNNDVIVELNIVDAADSPASTANEAVMRSPRSIPINVPKNALGVTKNRNLQVLNGDIVSLPLGLSVDVSSCPWLTVGPIDMDPSTPGIDSTVSVGPGKSKSVRVSFLVDPNLVSTPNRLAPLRCNGTATVLGPVVTDAEPSNDTSTLVIDVLDKNDQ